MSHIDALTATLATSVRALGRPKPPPQPHPRPAQPLVLYQYEACPMCRKAREALSALELPVEVRPCPTGGTRFRPEGKALNRTFPLLVDPNTGRQVGDSADIVAYLYDTYGPGPAPSSLSGPGFVLTSQLASLARAPGNLRCRPSRSPSGVWRLTGTEADPGTLRVRERLEALEQPYLWEPGPLSLTAPDGGEPLTDVDRILAHLDAACAPLAA